ncbi:META domain-containing protein [Candidatus Binatia bacterium]|nr:META domain-containing protein [Candidatus Binatia bacterium]
MSYPKKASRLGTRAARVLALVLVVVLTPLAPAPASEDAPPAAAALEGTTWRLVSLPGHDAAFVAAVPDGVTLQFAAGALQVFAGCNRLRGGYTIDGDRVTFGPMAGTLMACPPPLGDVEKAVTRALTGTQRFTVGGDELTLVSATNDALRFAKVPPPQLDGTSWTVTGFNNGRQAVVSALTGTTLTLAFRDGRVSGFAGCNEFHGTYTRDGDRLAIGRLATTRKACAGEGVMAQEQQLVAALESVTTWAIDRGMLDLHRADGERALTAERSASAPGS